MPKFCGGYKIGSGLKLVNGIVTSEHEVDGPTGIVSPCGAAFDDAVFTVMDVNGKHMLTSIGVESDMDIPEPISICGFNADSRYFERNNRTLLFHERYLMEVFPTPADATVEVTVTIDDGEPEPVAPIGNTLIFPMDETDGTYTVTVSAEGYTTQQQEVEASENQLIEIELVPTV